MTLYKIFAILGSIGLVLTVIRYFIERPLSPLVLLIQNFIGVFFIFSGFVKAIDPLGTSYKIEEYFVEFHMQFMEPYTLAFSVVTIVLEIVLGVALLLGYKKNLTAWLLLLLILFFTLLTGYTYLSGYTVGAWYNPGTWIFDAKNMKVTDCGCFGDFLKIVPKDSFLKDIFLTALILILFFKRKYIEPLFQNMIAAPLTVLATIGFTLFCFRNFAWNEPVFDFRPYKIGNYLPDMFHEVPDKMEYSWIYKNKESGEEKAFSMNQLDASLKDTTKWTYIRRDEKLLEKGIPAKATSFQIINDNGDDIFEDVIYNPDYQLIVVAYNLDKTCEKAFAELNEIAAAAEKNKIAFFALTSAAPEKRDAFRHDNQTAYPFYEADGTPLKTILRSNPGLLLLKDGTVKGKWHHNHFPTFEELKRDYLK